MAFWVFKYNPEKYRLDDRLADPNSVITWTVTRYREDIHPGDIAFVWETGDRRGIRAVIRIDAAPQDMPELDTEQPYWVEPDTAIFCRIVGTLTHRGPYLAADQLRGVPGLEHLSVFHGFQQATNFAVTPEQGAILMDLVKQGSGEGDDPVEAGTRSARTAPGTSRPAFEVGRVYDRRSDLHGPYGGQRQGGISTPTRFPAIFLFTGRSGEQYGYRDGLEENGVFRYTGEGQVGDMEFVRGNLAIRDHAEDGRDLHLFEALGKGEGYRYLGLFECAGWEYRRAPDINGQDRRVIVFHLVLEGAADLDKERAREAGGPLDELRRRALAAVHFPVEQTPRESRRTYRERSAAVRAYVLARAAGVCEACRKPAPFRRPDGTAYLEPHHTRRLADGGLDHPRWVGAVCPNCHAEVHHGEHGANLNNRLQNYLGTIEPAGEA
jgi:5-methylcytosine-specific restriction protein A